MSSNLMTIKVFVSRAAWAKAKRTEELKEWKGRRSKMMGMDISNPGRKRLYSFLLNIIFQDKPVYAIFFYANGAQNSLGITNPTHCSLTAYYVVASPFGASKDRHSIRPPF
ncbi:MAG: hypothetical protein ABH969_01440 [Pseudomonadota bacterium]